jgi:capsular exopolysaccharide synthesis family protein
MTEVAVAEQGFWRALRILRRRLPLVSAIVVVCTLLALASSLMLPKKYSAGVQLLVEPAPSVTSTFSGTQQTVSPTDILTELQLVVSPGVKAEAAQKLGFGPSISASQVGQSNVILVSATERTPALAARIANTYAGVFVAGQSRQTENAFKAAVQQYTNQINELNGQISSLSGSNSATSAATISTLAGQVALLRADQLQLQVAATNAPAGVEIVAPASPPTAPSSPRPVLYGALGFLIGLLLGMGAGLFVDRVQDRIYTKEEAERATGVPVLVEIGRVGNWHRNNEPRLIAEEDPFSPVTESYRSLGASLHIAKQDKSLKVVLVTGAGEGSGKTSTAANLGVILANVGNRVLLLNCDLRKPRLGKFIRLPETPGLTTVLLEGGTPRHAIQSVNDISGLYFLGTGKQPPNPAVLLGSEKMAEVMGALARNFDFILIDSPPPPIADTLALSSYVDVVVFVIGAGQNTRGEVEQAIVSLNRVNARPTGIVLNSARRSTVGSYGSLDLSERREPAGPPSSSRSPGSNGSSTSSPSPGSNGSSTSSPSPGSNGSPTLSPKPSPRTSVGDKIPAPSRGRRR